MGFRIEIISKHRTVFLQKILSSFTRICCEGSIRRKTFPVPGWKRSADEELSRVWSLSYISDHTEPKDGNVSIKVTQQVHERARVRALSLQLDWRIFGGCGQFRFSIQWTEWPPHCPQRFSPYTESSLPGQPAC